MRPSLVRPKCDRSSSRIWIKLAEANGGDEAKDTAQLGWLGSDQLITKSVSKRRSGQRFEPKTPPDNFSTSLKHESLATSFISGRTFHRLGHKWQIYKDSEATNRT